MRFQGLPVEMHVGRAELTPVSPCSLLTECAFCKDVNPSFMVCVNNHTICQGCAVSAQAPGTATWCPVCKKIVTATAVFIELDMLSQIQFRCQCSFEGTLPQMKLHILKDGMHLPARVSADIEPELPATLRLYGGLEVEKPPVPATQKLDSADQDTNAKMNAREIVLRDVVPMIRKQDEKSKKDVLQRVTEMRSGLLQQIESLLEKTTSDIEAKIDASKDLILAKCRLATAPLGYLWFNIAELTSPQQVGPIDGSSELQRTHVAGFLMELYIKLDTVNDEQYLNAYGGLVQVPGVSLPLPLKRKIILSVHDQHGRVVSSEAFNTYDKASDKYFFGCGAVDQDRRYSGTNGLLLFNSLQKENCVVEGKVCISIELLPMEIL